MSAPRKMPLRLLVLAVLVTAAVLFWWVLSRPPLVTLASPTRGPAVEAVYAAGTVEPQVEVRIAPRTGGRLSQLLVDEGDTVRKDQVLGRIEAPDLQSTVREQEARLRQAERDYARQADLLKQGWVTRSAMDAVLASRDAARAAVARARQQLGYVNLIAPENGTVISRDGEVGDYIAVNQPVFFLACCGGLRISAQVDEEDIPDVAAGDKVHIRADAFPDRLFAGEVAEITPRGDEVARTYRVRISLPEDTPLMVGMTTDNNIITAERQNALLVPTAAIRVGPDGSPAVWRYADGEISQVPVKVGVRGADRTEILAGLGAQDRLVTSPAEGLEDGQKVRIAPGGDR